MFSLHKMIVHMFPYLYSKYQKIVNFETFCTRVLGKMICMILLLLILPVDLALEINKKISDVKNHISVTRISISTMADHVIL